MVKKGTSHFPVSFFLFSRCEPEKRNVLFSTMKSLQRNATTLPSQCERQSLLRGPPLAFSCQLTAKKVIAMRTKIMSSMATLFRYLSNSWRG
jgi:hypothetical protein